MQEQKKHKWTFEEENKLVELASSDMSDKEIGERLGGLTEKQIYEKRRTLTSANGKMVERRNFALEEDEILIRYCTTHRRIDGRIMWNELNKYLPERSQRQCRDRWLNYISPDLNKRPWNEEEDKIVREVVKEYSPANKTFFILGKQLGRSGNLIRKHYFKSLAQILHSNGIPTLKRQETKCRLQRQIEVLNNASNDISNNILGNEQSQNNTTIILSPISTISNQLDCSELVESPLLPL